MVNDHDPYSLPAVPHLPDRSRRCPGAVAEGSRGGDRPHWLFRPLFRFQGARANRTGRGEPPARGRRPELVVERPPRSMWASEPISSVPERFSHRIHCQSGRTAAEAEQQHTGHPTPLQLGRGEIREFPRGPVRSVAAARTAASSPDGPWPTPHLGGRRRRASAPRSRSRR